MILVDTSAWIDFDRAADTPSTRRLTALVQEGGHAVRVSEPILMEVMAGARDDVQAQRLRRMLTAFDWLPTEPLTDFEGAARVYRKCRRHGVTPRGLTDCIVANIALRTGAQILACDQDFPRMAEVIPLKIATV